jgi:hypothetical protein
MEFTLVDGKLTITKTPLVYTSCMRTGALSGIAGSYEPFVVTGPWTLGANELKSQLGVASNQYVTSSKRTINYRMKDTAQTAGKVTGTLSLSYSHSYLIPGGPPDFRWYSVFVNCAGTSGFEAIPAP